jgi:hypothetical protein
MPRIPVTVLGTSAANHAGVGDHDDVGVEPIASLGEQRLEVRRARFLFAFDEELQRDRRRGAFGGREVGTQPE